MATKIQLRRDTSTAWTRNNPVLAIGEPGLETDTGYIKYGDGSSRWTDLSYVKVKSTDVDLDLTTANVSESSSALYFTNARAYANVVNIGYASNTHVNTQLATKAGVSDLANKANVSDLNDKANVSDLVLKANITDLNTSNVIEGSNLYFNNTRAIGALTGGNNISIESNGLITATVVSLNGYTPNTYFESRLNSITTSEVTEGTGLYFTNTRAIGSFTAGNNISIESNGLVSANITGLGVSSVNGQSGTVSLSTANIAESSNLYYTNDRVYSNVNQIGYASNAYVNSRLKFTELDDASITGVSVDRFSYHAVATLIVTDNTEVANITGQRPGYGFGPHYCNNCNNNVYVISGTTIAFRLQDGNHPFTIKRWDGAQFANLAAGLIHVSPSGNSVSSLASQGLTSGTLYWKVPVGSSANIYIYESTEDSANFYGNIFVKEIYNIP